MGQTALYIGLMSGTSLDGIDAALVDLGRARPQLLSSFSVPFEPGLRQQLLSLCRPGDNEIERMGYCDEVLALAYANAVNSLLQQNQLSAKEIKAIGCHGQTIRHCPNHPEPFTLQIGNANRLAFETGITTVADFRRADMAAGGQGAPLAPAFHAYLAEQLNSDSAFLNLGGIANLTFVPGDKSQPIIGFDTGPANVLSDYWISKCLNQNMDIDGAWAKQGQVIEPLLQEMLAEPYLGLPPPKSTGRELFNGAWLEQILAGKQLADVDIAATLIEFTAKTVAISLQSLFPSAKQLFVCGGGAHNSLLMSRLDQLLECQVNTTELLGIGPDWIEACAFAWFAQRRLENKPANCPTVTGANSARVLGAIYHP